MKIRRVISLLVSSVIFIIAAEHGILSDKEWEAFKSFGELGSNLNI